MAVGNCRHNLRQIPDHSAVDSLPLRVQERAGVLFGRVENSSRKYHHLSATSKLATKKCLRSLMARRSLNVDLRVLKDGRAERDHAVLNPKREYVSSH